MVVNGHESELADDGIIPSKKCCPINQVFPSVRKVVMNGFWAKKNEVVPGKGIGFLAPSPLSKRPNPVAHLKLGFLFEVVWFGFNGAVTWM